MDKTQPYVIYMTSQPVNLAIDPACQGDPFYRYKMRQLQVQVIGNGKMVRTSLTNLEDVSKDLNLPPAYIPNYLAKVIGAQAKYDKKRPERERGSISGEYPLEELSDHLVRFIRDFVLCKKCRYPELNYVGQGNKKDVKMICRSCGWKGLLSSLKDVNEKFRRYVINNPPPKSTIMATTNSSMKSPSSGSADSKNTSATSSSPAAAPKPSDGDAVVATNNRKQPAATREGSAEKNVGDDDWAIDTSEEAAKERMETLVPDRLKALVASEKNAKEEPAAEQLRKVLTASTKPSNEQVINEVVRLQKDLFLDETARNATVFEAVFTDTLSNFTKLVERVKIAKEALRKYISASAAGQRELIAAMDSFTAKQPTATKSAILKLVPSILKFLYDEDILDEENILIWYGGLVNKPTQFVKAADPFCKWLEEADEEAANGNGKAEEDDGTATAEEDDSVPEAQPEDAATAAEIDAL